MPYLENAREIDALLGERAGIVIGIPSLLHLPRYTADAAIQRRIQQNC